MKAMSWKNIFIALRIFFTRLNLNALKIQTSFHKRLDHLVVLTTYACTKQLTGYPFVQRGIRPIGD